MKNIKPLIVVGLLLGLSRLASATCTGGGDPCNAPRNGSITAHSATTITESVQNSATANPTSSVYFFQETTVGSAQNSGTPDLNTVIVLTEDFTNPALASDVIGDIVKPLLASTSYQGYAKVCPSGSSVPTAAGCSAWVAVGSPQTTDALTNAGFSDIAAADTQPQQFTARTNTSVVDQTDVAAWLTTLVHSTEVGDCTISNSVQPFPSSGVSQLTITSSDCNTLVPNRPYFLTEHLVYDPTQAAPPYTANNNGITAFYTQAANPVPINSAGVGATNITHCSARLDFQNAVASPANPDDTTYAVNVGGPVSSGSATATQVIGGTGIYSNTNFVTFTNLQAGQTYSPTVTADNRGGSPWLNSATESYDTFQTISWSGSFSVTGITTTDASFNILSLDTTGVSSWQLVLNENLVGSSNSGTPPAAPSSITYSSQGITLTPNTAYQAQIELVEASGCSSRLPVTPVSFTTNADVPTGFALSIVSPTQLNASWNIAGNPSSGVTYQVQYCTGIGFTGTCATTSSTTNSLSLTGLTPETTYYAHVLAESVGNGANSAYSNTDFKMTPNQAPTLSAVVSQVWTTSATLTTTSTDNGGPTHLVFVWAATAGGSLTSTAGTTSINGGTATNVTQVLFSGANAANGTVYVYDHDHDGSSQMLSTNENWGTSSSQTPTTLSISPGTITVGTGQVQNFDVTVFDQFGAQIVGSTASWTIAAGGGSVSPVATSTYTVLTAGTTPAVYQLTATNGIAVGTATVTVSATAPHFTVAPSATVYLTTATFTASATSINGPSSISYTWSLLTPAGVPVDYSVNGSNAASTTIATFHESDLYTFRCTITDTTPGFGGSTYADFPVTVSAVLEALTVTPNPVTININESKQFSTVGTDQFSLPITPTGVTWTASAGTIGASNGIFTDPTIVTNATIRAQSGSIFNTALVTVVSYDVSGAYAYPVPYKTSQGVAGVTFKGLGSSAKIRIYTSSGREVFNTSTTTDTYLWPVKNSSGENVASGVYFYVIESPDNKKDGKLIIIK